MTDVKTCTKCGATKPVADFAKKSTWGDGLQAWCRSCFAAWWKGDGGRQLQARRLVKHTARMHDPAYRATRRRYRRTTNLKRYGLTPQDYQRLFDAQGGVCAICERPETKIRHGRIMRLAVDHDHETSAVRGLLCSTCNIILGSFGDNPAVLQRAHAYLTRRAANLKLVVEGD